MQQKTLPYKKKYKMASGKCSIHASAEKDPSQLRPFVTRRPFFRPLFPYDKWPPFIRLCLRISPSNWYGDLCRARPSCRRLTGGNNAAERKKEENALYFATRKGEVWCVGLWRFFRCRVIVVSSGGICILILCGFFLFLVFRTVERSKYVAELKFCNF